MKSKKKIEVFPIVNGLIFIILSLLIIIPMWKVLVDSFDLKTAYGMKLWPEEDGSLNYTHTFKKPREIEGKKYTKLTFYFDNLTGEDIEAVEQELADQNKYALSPEISSAFQCILAAKAAGVASDEIRRLPVGDYMKIKNKARDFLIAAGY